MRVSLGNLTGGDANSLRLDQETLMTKRYPELPCQKRTMFWTLIPSPADELAT
jgi:hypothetical protein